MTSRASDIANDIARARARDLDRDIERASDIARDIASVRGNLAWAQAGFTLGVRTTRPEAIQPPERLELGGPAPDQPSSFILIFRQAVAYSLTSFLAPPLPSTRARTTSRLGGCRS